jgi:hypothetical protein
MITKILFADTKLSEKVLIDNGNTPLLVAELKQKILNKSIYGDYYIGRTYIICIDEHDKMTGTNDLGTQDIGQCIFDETHNTLSTKWINGWDNWTGRAYEIENNIKFFDTGNGMWRTTFKKINSQLKTSKNE